MNRRTPKSSGCRTALQRRTDLSGGVNGLDSGPIFADEPILGTILAIDISSPKAYNTVHGYKYRHSVRPHENPLPPDNRTTIPHPSLRAGGGKGQGRLKLEKSKLADQLDNRPAALSRQDYKSQDPSPKTQAPSPPPHEHRGERSRTPKIGKIETC
jgi:hypothetical protein